MRVNREMVKEDYEKIKAFAELRGWDMQTTETGLWYMIYGGGRGEKAVAGKIATVEYTVSLMDSIGTVCYSSAVSGPKVFKTGKGGADGRVESGLEEGILLLRAGDRARLIMPPHLGHGLIGDGDCIPKRAIVIYEIELVNLK